MKILYINGKYVQDKDARISVFDRGLLYGDGVFETMRAYGGVVFKLDEHLERLYRSLKALAIGIPVARARMKRIVCRILERNRLQDASVKIIVTGGRAGGLLLPSGRTKASTIVYASLYAPYPKRAYEKGYRLCMSGRKLDETSRIAGHKTLNYLSNVLWRREAAQRGFDDVILVNKKGLVSEASSSNVFLVKQGRLLTPSLTSGCLPGITRKTVIGIARLLGHSVAEGNMKVKSIYSAGEVFLTNSLAEIIPVVRIGQKKIGNGGPGPVTKRIMEAFRSER
jgi:branched-chain amino acid aminotransferase